MEKRSMKTLNELYPTARRLLAATTDLEGRPIIRIQVNDGRFATVDEDDFHRLMDIGLSPNWFINSNGHSRTYVRAKFAADNCWDNIVMVSRLILTPGTRGVVVRHKDVDPLNLRRDNLFMEERKSRAIAWEKRILNDPMTLSASFRPSAALPS